MKGGEEKKWRYDSEVFGWDLSASWLVGFIIQVSHLD